MVRNKSLAITFTFFFFSVLVYAQKGKDSIYIFQQDKNLIDNILFSPTFSNGNDLTNYGILKLDFKRETGGLRRAQEAYNVSMPKFLAKGFNILGKFRIAGSFEFNKSFEDSLANGQKNNLDDFSTFYPYANKSGNYERQNYIFKTSISYDALNNHLSPYLNLDYHKHWSTGSVDPRLNSNRFILKVSPGVVIKTKKHALGIYGTIGKADEQVSLAYKNDNYKTSLLYPDRIHYMQYGYGSSRIKDTSNVYKYDQYRGAGIQYALNLKDWNVQFSTAYELYKNKNYDRSKTTLGFATVGVFNLNTITSSLLLNKKTYEKGDQQILLDLTYNEGYDGNIKTSGSLNRVNYRVKAFNLNASYYYLWNKTRKSPIELGLTFAYAQNEKQDLGQSSALSYEQLQIGISGKLYRKIDAQSTVKFSLAPYYIMPLNTTLKYNPNSLTEFIRNVVFTDYYYFNNKTIGAEIYGEYISSKLIKNQQFGLYFQLDYRHQLKQELRVDLNPTFIPNNHRSIFHLGMNMYL
ncbi:MAG: hypothetical protein V4663_11495 [Bacteroidota bacterium]